MHAISDADFHCIIPKAIIHPNQAAGPGGAMLSQKYPLEGNNRDSKHQKIVQIKKISIHKRYGILGSLIKSIHGYTQ